MSLLCRAVVLGLILAFDLPELTLGDIKPHQGHRWGSSLSPSNAQSYPLQRTPAQPPASHTPGLTRLPQDPQDPQVKVDFQGPVRLDWHYPLVVETQIPVSPDFTLRTPTAPTGNVAVQCGENRVHVEVHQDFFSNGVMIEPAGITMGGCPVAGQNPGLLIFDYELQQCDSVIMITEDELVYTFSLVYIPEALPGTPITRADGAVVGVQCHYKRLQNVSSDAINPAWIPYASTEVAEDVLVFSLNLMTDDWAYQRPSNVYFLGDYINIEASVMVYNHIPLRIYVDHCVATQKSDVNSVPRYSFIENYGCFVDSKETVSNSRFMPRTQQNKIQFQLEAFLFQGSDLSQIYITCLLKATSASTPSDPLGKACSYTGRTFIYLALAGSLLMEMTRHVAAVTPLVLLLVVFLVVLVPLLAVVVL
ncbi:hypothetical protein DNTS_028191 [Danionella cerebrum]|uniref:Zona pellucida sperm-binding protein 3 n=1 Tax=Danionella cerebrum TaxID=2873325 RepID=A0A553QRC6_9TELE|nr:hypothetical protein DNTS_028191 [Danionella translucida]